MAGVTNPDLMQLLAAVLAGDAAPPPAPSDILAEAYKSVQNVLDLGVPPELLPPALSVFYKMRSQATQETPNPYPHVRPDSDTFSPWTREDMRKEIDACRKWVEQERELLPAKTLPMYRNNLLRDVQRSRKDWEKRLSTGPGYGVRTIIGLGRHVSNTEISDLTRISISDLLVRKVHHGRYLLCRVFGPSVRTVGVSIPVEDPEGNVHRLLVFNYPTADYASPKDVDALFPLGLVLAIREPSFEMATIELDIHSPFICVDSPTDIIHVDERTPALFDVKWKTGTLVRDARPVPSNAEAWKQAGNDHFKRGLWFPAAMAYTRGLILDPKAYLIRLNRAEAFLRLRYFPAALADAQEVLILPDLPITSREKALFRAAKACYGRGDYDTASVKLVELLRLNPKHKDASEELKRVQVRLREVRNREYDWVTLHKQGESSPRVDAADYVGPVKIAALEGRGGGRGIVATRSISVGELLMVAKPLISVWPQDLPANETAQSLNPLTGDGLFPTQLALRGRLISELYGNPELCEVVHALYAGPNLSLPPLDFPLVSTPPAIALDLGLPTVGILTGRIEEIIPYNCFGLKNTAVPASSPAPTVESEGNSLYLLPSLFNHSCLPNTSKVTIGDLMVIRALEPIAAGAEITLDYGMGVMSADEEKSNKLKHYLDGADCMCTHCKADRIEGPAARQKRHKLCQAALKTSKEKAPTIPRLYEIEKELEASYSAPRVFYEDLRNAREIIAYVYDLKGLTGVDVRLWLKSAEEYIEVLSAAGLKIIDNSTSGPLPKTSANKLPISKNRIPFGRPEKIVKDMLQVAHRFHLAGDDQRCERWLKASIWSTSFHLSG